MADQVLQLEVRLENGQLKVATRESKDQIKGFADETEKAGKKSKSAFDGIAEGVNVAKAAIAGFMALKLVGYVKDLVVSAVKSAAAFETQALSLETMLGSAEKAKLMLGKLQAFATATPFTLPGLASATEMMLGFGIAADDIIPNLKMLGDVSGGNEQKLNSLTLAFSQVSSNGKLMGQDLLQMINAGFNPLNEMSKTTGKSMGQLKQEMEKGGISAGMVRDAFISATGPGGQFAGMMDRQSQSLNGLSSTMEDTYGELGRMVGNKLLPVLKLMVIDATSAGEGLKDAAESVGIFIAESVSSFMIGFNRIRLFAAEYKRLKAEVIMGVDEIQLRIAELSGQGGSKFANQLRADLYRQKAAWADNTIEIYKAEKAIMQYSIAHANASKKAAATPKDAGKPGLPSKPDEFSGAGGVDKAAEEYTQKKALLDEFNMYDLSQNEFNQLKKNEREQQAVNYYEQVLRAKLGLDSRYAQGLATVTSTASTFMAQENIALFRFGQALAITKGVQDTASGILKAWSMGPILGPIGAAIVGTAGALQIADIAKQKPPQPPAQKVKIETPVLETGGFVQGSYSGTMVTVGEKGKSEAVVPFENDEYMNKFREAMMPGGINIYISGNLVDSQNLLELVDALQDERARNMGATKYTLRTPY